MSDTKYEITTKHGRIKYVDVVRGIAIIGVLILHLFPADSIVVEYVRSWNVAVFFILSGILLYHNESWKSSRFADLCIKKAGSLLYPFYTFSFITIVFYLIIGNLSNAVKGIIKTVLLDGILALWFLPALFISEMAFFAVKRTKNVIIEVAFLGGTLIMTSLFGMLRFYEMEGSLLANVLREINVLNRALIGTVFVFIGYYYELIVNTVEINRIIYFVSIVGAGVVNLLLFRINVADLHFSDLKNPFLYYINSIIGTYFIINISKELLSECRPLELLGKYSLIIFATHQTLDITELSWRVSEYLFGKSFLIFDLCLVLLIEIVIVFIINRYFAFLLDFKHLRLLLDRRSQKV